MKPGAILALVTFGLLGGWCLDALLTRHANRFQFHTGNDGLIMWRTDTATGRAWVANIQDHVWRPVTDAFSFDAATN